MTLEPDGDGDVAVTLEADRDCAESGAICTKGEPRRRLTTTVSAMVAGPDGAANAPATGAPAIAGRLRVGEILSALTWGIADEDGLEEAEFAHQWLRGDADIAGATGYRYTLADSDEGGAIRVRVTFTDDAGNNETLTSTTTDAVAAAPAANNPAAGAPTISGTAQVGETLTAYTSEIVDEDGLSNVQYEYQWLADDTAIAGATALTYTLVAADEAKAIKVQVSFSDDAGHDETLTSGATYGAARQAHGPLRHGVARLGDPHLGRPRRRLHHRLRNPQARPRERCRGRVQCIGSGYGQRRDHLHRQHSGCWHYLHLPDQGHQRGRNE